LTKRHYYSTYTGLLNAIEETEKISFYKRGQIKSSLTRKTESIINEYQTVEQILLPYKIKKTITILESDLPKEDKTIYQERELSNINLITTSL